MTKIDYIGKCLLLRNINKKTGKKKKILVIGDLHLGYEEALNKTGVFVTRQMFEEMIKEFDLIFEKIEKKYEKKELAYTTKGLEIIGKDGMIRDNKSNIKDNDGGVGGDEGYVVDEIVLLGDVKHVFGTIMKQEWGDVLKLFDYLLEKGKKVVVVEGNHDAILEPIVKQRKEIQLEEFYVDHNVIFLHGDKDFEQIWDDEIDIVILGHIHPAVKLSGGAKVEKYKCFLDGIHKNKKFMLVPSFSEYSKGIDIREYEIKNPWNIDFKKFNVKVVNGLKILDFGKLKKLNWVIIF